MDLNKIEILLEKTLANKNDENSRCEYEEQLVIVMNSKPLPKDIISLTIKGISIDQGANFFACVDGMTNEEIKAVWKDIKKTPEFKKNRDINVFRFLCSAIVNCLIGGKNLQSLLGGFITFWVNTLEIENDNLCEVEEAVFMYIFDNLPEIIVLPEWKSIRILPENIEKFVNIMRLFLHKLSSEKEKEYGRLVHLLKVWLEEGEKYAWNKKAEEDYKKNRIEKKAIELEKLFEHYKAFEENADKLYLENTQLRFESSQLRKQIDKAQAEMNALSRELLIKKAQIDEQQQEIEKFTLALEESRTLNASMGEYRKQAEVAMLNDIADEIAVFYKDYIETIDDEMDEMLGNIYRDHIGKIFKILAKKGIEVK